MGFSPIPFSSRTPIGPARGAGLLPPLRSPRLSGPDFEWGDWVRAAEPRGVQGLTTDDAPAYGPVLWDTGLDRQPCTVHMQPWAGTSVASTT